MFFAHDVAAIRYIELQQKVIDWAERYDRSHVSARDVYTAKIVKNAEESQQLLNDMEKDGLGKWEQLSSKKRVLTLLPLSAVSSSAVETEDLTDKDGS